MNRIDWDTVLRAAAAAVRLHDALGGITLRQLYWNLVTKGNLPATPAAYKTLSARVAQARRNGVFPALVDIERKVERPLGFADVEDARRWLHENYRRDRTQGQKNNVWLGIQSASMVPQVAAWFGDLGLPVICLGWYSSQTYVADVCQSLRDDGRNSVLVYAQDLVPSTSASASRWKPLFHTTQQVAVTIGQIDRYNLRGGEVESVPPTKLRDLFYDTVREHYEIRQWRRVQIAEQEDLAGLLPEVCVSAFCKNKVGAGSGGRTQTS